MNSVVESWILLIGSRKALSRRRLKGTVVRAPLALAALHESESGRRNRHGFHLICRALGVKRRPLGSTWPHPVASLCLRKPVGQERQAGDGASALPRTVLR
jgi:hypothetical protein